MGIFMIAGASARIAGPSFAGPALNLDNQRITFGVLLAVWGVGMIMLVAAYRRLVPVPIVTDDEVEPLSASRSQRSISFSVPGPLPDENTVFIRRENAAAIEYQKRVEATDREVGHVLSINETPAYHSPVVYTESVYPQADESTPLVARK